MEVEIRLPVADIGRLTEILVSNGFENLFVRTVPLSKGIEWTGVTALAESQRNVNVLVRSQNDFNLSALTDQGVQDSIDLVKPGIEEITDDPNKENSPSRIMPPASLVYDLFGSPEAKVGIDQMRALVAQPINLNSSILSNNINYGLNSSCLRSRRVVRPATTAKVKKICNICGTVKTLVDDQIKHCMLHYNIKRYKCSICGIERKTLNFKIHFEKVCQNGVVVDLVVHDRVAMLQKVAEMFTTKH